jgi:hypothetical protein
MISTSSTRRILGYYLVIGHYRFFLNPYLLTVCAFRVEVFAAVKIQLVVLWVVAPCSVVVMYQRFGGQLCLYLRGECLHLRETLSLIQQGYIKPLVTYDRPQKYEFCRFMYEVYDYVSSSELRTEPEYKDS